MKINFNQRFNKNSDFFIRRCGYGQIHDRRTGQFSYVRRLRGSLYPRFHLYIGSEDPLILNLHLDQKQVSYEGQHAHSGEYDSDLVKQEGQRIYQQIIKEAQAASQELKQSQEGDLNDEKKSLFGWLFGKK